MLHSVVKKKEKDETAVCSKKLTKQTKKVVKIKNKKCRMIVKNY